MIAIIDYGMGNLRSIHNALKKVGGDPVIMSDSAKFSGADEVSVNTAALAASIFHFGEYTVSEVKDYLKKNGIHVRI